MKRILLLPGILALFVLVSCTSNSSLPLVAEPEAFVVVVRPDSVEGEVRFNKRVDWKYNVVLINSMTEPLRLWGFTWTDYRPDGTVALSGDVNDPRLKDRWLLRGKILQPGEITQYNGEIERNIWKFTEGRQERVYTAFLPDGTLVVAATVTIELM